MWRILLVNLLTIQSLGEGMNISRYDLLIFELASLLGNLCFRAVLWLAS
ncbi:hypothetical protein [Nostoc sp.]